MNKIKRPTDNYSPAWAAYWDQNPGMRRSVGADGTDDPPSDPPTIDPAQFAELKEELERWKAKHKESEKHLKEKERLAKEAAEEAARKSGDIEALEKSLHEKYAREIEELKSTLESRDSTINKITVGSEAQRLASDLAVPGSADVMRLHIERRLQMEIKDGSPSIRVLDKDGKPSAYTVDDLRKEFETNPAFAPLIVGSKANGSGGVGGKGVAGNGDVMKLSPVERMNAGRSAKA